MNRRKFLQVLGISSISAPVMAGALDSFKAQKKEIGHYPCGYIFKRKTTNDYYILTERFHEVRMSKLERLFTGNSIMISDVNLMVNFTLVSRAKTVSHNNKKITTILPMYEKGNKFDIIIKKG
jgi:hypothetical protein